MDLATLRLRFSAFPQQARRRKGKIRQRRTFSLRLERLEDRAVPSVDAFAQFLINSANTYAISDNAADANQPTLFAYRDFNNDPVYGIINDNFNVTLDGNDANAGRGRTSFRMTWNGPGPNAYFQFGFGAGVANRPRDIPDFGFARAVRFLAQGDVSGRQLQVNIYRTTPSGGFSGPVASQWFLLTTSFADYTLTLPPNLRPQDIHAVQFLIDQTHGAGPGATVRLDEIRINADGFDPLRVVQSFVPQNTSQVRDVSVYPNFSSLYDNALTVKALYATGDAAARQTARAIINGILATGGDGTTAYFNALTAGHVLLGNGTPRSPRSQQKTLGDNGWFGLALLDVYRVTGDTQYLTRARLISDWAEINLKASGPLKGYKGGFDANGAPVPWRATEHNIDHFALNDQLALILQQQVNPAAQTYAERARYAGDFVIVMFDPVEGKFWTGTGAGDTINRDSVPLDTQTWSYLALGRSAQYAGAIDWNRPIAWAETRLARGDGAFLGFTYSTASTPNRVWFEGVAQGASVYRIQGNATKLQQSLQTLTQAKGTTPGVPAASSDDLQDVALGAVYDHRLAVASTAWTWFASNNVNPLVDVNTTRPGQLEFSQATYSMTAVGGNVTIQVNRTNGSRGTVEVRYATRDGSARAGVDYRATVGPLMFAAGEIRKDITISVLDDDLVKRNRTVLVVLSDPTGGVTLGGVATTTLTLVDKDLPRIPDSGPSQNLGQAGVAFAKTREAYQNIVINAYSNYLGRTPDPEGLEGWVQRMFAGLTEEQLEAGFIGSLEFIRNNGGQGRGWIVAMYEKLLRRTPSESEVQAWLAVLARSVPEYEIAFGFSASEERERQRIASNYRTLLDREPSRPEVDAWFEKFRTGMATNQDIIVGFVSSGEYYSKSSRGNGNRAHWIASAYEDVLRRSPARSEVEAWLRFLS